MNTAYLIQTGSFTLLRMEISKRCMKTKSMNRTAVCFVKIIFDFIFPESEEPHFLISGKKINVCNIELWNNVERNFAHSR